MAGALAAAAPSSARCTECGAVAAAAAVRGEGASGAEGGVGAGTDGGGRAGEDAERSRQPSGGKDEAGQDCARAPMYELAGARSGRAGA